MSTQVAQPVKAKSVPFMSKGKEKKIPVKKRPLQCHRRPNMLAADALRSCTWKLIEDGYSYDESLELLRLYLINAAMKCAKDVKKHAAVRLGISRYHLDNYLARGKGLL